MDNELFTLESLGDFECASELPNMVRCSECRYEGPVEGCETEEESEGWEYPSYTVHICPACGYTIDDYFCSEPEEEDEIRG